MISENLSHDSIILEEIDTKRNILENGIKELEKLDGYEDITHDVFKWINPKIKSKVKRGWYKDMICSTKR